MENNRTSGPAPPKGQLKLRMLLAFSLSILIQGSFYYHLLREQFSWMVQRQKALESMNVLAVPGSQFMIDMGSPAVLKSSLFFLLLLGPLLAVFIAFSLLFERPWKRMSFLFAGLLVLFAVTFRDRACASFLLIAGISFASFFALTLRCKIDLSWREVLFVLAVIILISGSLLYGTRHKFFLKVRDTVLFDTTPGNQIISFYYAYSPLAASLISPEKGVYQGLVFYIGAKDEKPRYLGNGLFLTGDERVGKSADFSISAHEKGLTVTNRLGRSLPVKSLQPKEIDRAANDLFSMKGFLLLTRMGLCLFPAGVLILALLAVRWLTDSRKVFVHCTLALAGSLLIVIWTLSLSATTPTDPPQPAAALSRGALATAYDLDATRRIPDAYNPMVKMMAGSKSTALRYWGARLLGRLGDRNEVPTLMALLQDPCPNIRYAAAYSLYHLLKEDSFKALEIPLMTDSSWYVRCRIFSVFLKAGMIPSPA